METRSITAQAFPASASAVEARAPRAPQQAAAPPDSTAKETSTPLTAEKLDDAAAVANRALSNLSTGVRLRIDKESDQVVAQFVDADDKVIKQIPPEEMLHIAANMRKLEGLLFNRQA